MDMPKVECMNMVEEQDHPMNHRWGKEDIHMMDSHMVKVEGMDTVVEHYHPMNHQLKVAGIDTVEEHYHMTNHRPEVEGMDREDSGMRENMTVEVEVVGREPDGMVLVRHWTGDGVTRHRQTRQEWEELVKSECLKGQPMFVSRDFNCCLP
jgi:hypothetical protein